MGDVGQFLKVALMRWLVSPSPYGHGYQLGVIWFQEPGVHRRSDGENEASIEPADATDEDLRLLDPDLYDRLRLMAASSGRPVSVRESCSALPTGTVCFDRPLSFDDLIRNDRAARVVSRQRWFHAAMVAIAPCSLVFLDSDNGLADDDVSMSEIGQLLEGGRSVVTHQLADPSQSLPELVKAQMSATHETLGAEPLAAARESHGSVRLFTVIPHHRHRSDLQDRIGALQASRWGDEFRVYRWRSDLVTA